MQTRAAVETVFAGIFGGWDVVLRLAVTLILFGGKKIPEIARGLKQGGVQFLQSLRNLLDDEAHSAGSSLGGIYGKRAAQALTPDNQTAELYDPAVFREQKTNRWRPRWLQFWQQLQRTVRRWFAS